MDGAVAPAGVNQRRSPLRLSLTLPGGASLGAYQAGAVAALLVGVQELRRRGQPVVVDAVGGASSGSLVALFAAQCLLARLHLVVDPRSEGPSGSGRWSDPSASPSWTAGIGRALAILPAQALYDDLRRVAANNRRLEAIDQAAERLGPLLGDEARAAVAEAAGEHGEGADEVDLVRRLLLRLSGLEGQQHAHVELISPLLLAGDADRDVPGLLAGEFFGTFAGFLSERMRESDYVLGWASTRSWLQAGLQGVGLEPEPVEQAAAAVDRVRSADWRSVNLGRHEPGALSRRERRALAQFALRVVRVLAGELLRSSRRRR